MSDKNEVFDDIGEYINRQIADGSINEKGSPLKCHHCDSTNTNIQYFYHEHAVKELVIYLFTTIVFVPLVCLVLVCSLPVVLSGLVKYEDQITQPPIEQLDLMVHDSHGVKKVGAVTKFE
ncbi:hypothetical protein [Paenibacillus polymyxa]|nr:hypothetical protein [Paenibacillus polymyxa]WPQ59930.1 hypothetical protein SKN87_27190 [Paenibacillus polymyxa]